MNISSALNDNLCLRFRLFIKQKCKWKYLKNDIARHSGMDTMLFSTSPPLHTHHLPPLFCLFIMILQLYLNNIIDFFPPPFPSSFRCFHNLFLPLTPLGEDGKNEDEDEGEDRTERKRKIFMSSQKFLYKNYDYLHCINITLVVGCLVIWNKRKK